MLSSALLSLALLPTADAAGCCRSKVINVSGGTDVNRVAVVLPPDEVADVSAELEGETVPFTASNAWAHGTAALSAAPADGAEITLAVYDDGSLELGTFTGTFKGGLLTLTGKTAADLEVLAATVYADGTVGLDLAGVDALSVASAKLTSVATTTVAVCVASDKSGCLKWDTKTTTTKDSAELDLDDLGVVWESDDLTLDGVATAKISAYDARGKRLDKIKVDVAPAWDDGGSGVNALAIDDDPLTTCALISDELHNGGTVGFLVVSDGWTLGDAMPEVAEVAVEGGETWTVAANSYQVTSLVDLGKLDLAAIKTVEVDGVALEVGYRERLKRKWFSLEVSRSALTVVTGADGHAWASLTTWSDDPADLPTDATITVDGVKTAVSFDEEIAVVFGVDAALGADPHGLDLLGKVKLKGPADAKGKRETLAKGKFAGQFSVDFDGDLALAGIDPDADTVSSGDVVVDGLAIGLDDGGEPIAPPAIVTKADSNGKGTRHVATANNGSPGLL